MQPGWLDQYYHQHVDDGCEHGDAGEAGAVAAEGEVSRRDFVKTGFVTGMVAGMVVAQTTGGAAPAAAQQPTTNPISNKWWPSALGEKDEQGAGKRITPAKVMEAAKLIKTGKVYPLGRVIERGIPNFGDRVGGHVLIPGTPTGGPFGKHQLYYHDEFYVGEIGQTGSQFDGLGHIGMTAGDGKIRYYNGFTQEEVGSAYGLKKLGAEHMKPFFTRGILLDVLALKGGDRLPINYVITVDDIVQTLRKQNIKEPGEGDAVIFNTGHGKLWKKDNAEYNKGCPGPGITAGRWLADKKIAVVGADSWPVEAVPGENPDLVFGCHAIWITMHGIHINENLFTEDLAKDRVYEFAWSFNPLPLKGATGSPGNSVAIS